MNGLLASKNIVGAVGWVALLIVLIGAFWLVWVFLRRWFHREIDSAGDGAPWTMQQLRELRDTGEITIEEFDRLRQQVIGGFKDTE